MTQNTNTNTQAQFIIGNDIDALISSDRTTKRAGARMAVSIVETHRNAPSGDVSILQDNDGNVVVSYEDLRVWAINPDDMASDKHKKHVTSVKASLLAASERGAALIAAIDDAATFIKDNSKSTDPSVTVKLNLKRVQKDQDTATRNAALRDIERAVFAAVWAIENPDNRRVYKTLTLARQGSVATIENEHGQTMPAPLTTWAKALRADWAKWNAPEGAPKLDTRAEDAPDHDSVTEEAPDMKEKRDPRVKSEQEAEKALAGVAAMRGGDNIILSRALSIAAHYNEEIAPKGETRANLLALHRAISALFTDEQIAAYDKKHA